MNGKKLFDIMGNIDEELINNADGGQKKKGIKTYLKIAMAACLVIALSVGIYGTVLNANNRIELSTDSKNVRVHYTSKKNNFAMPAYDLAYLTMDEIVNRENSPIIRGTVTKISNIEIIMNGEKEYESIAEISVQKVYRGDIGVGDTVEVLLPFPAGIGVACGNDVLSQLQVGMEGIFIPVKYDESSLYIKGDSVLCLRDLAPYGLMDGERFAFLESEDGLLFSEWAFPELNSTDTLNDAEEFILSVMK